MSRLAIAAIALATGCADYAHVATLNAPGNVPDLDSPLDHENGDPKRIQDSVSPGVSEHWLWTVPYLTWGRGRDGHDGSEAGFQLRYEHHDLVDESQFAPDQTTLIVTAGVAIAQSSDHHPTIAPAALFAELGVRGISGEVGPVELGGGPVVYPDRVRGVGHDVGGQITARLWDLFPVRVRYTDHGGLEVMGGVEIPIAFLFGRSK